MSTEPLVPSVVSRLTSAITKDSLVSWGFLFVLLGGAVTSAWFIGGMRADTRTALAAQNAELKAMANAILRMEKAVTTIASGQNVVGRDVADHEARIRALEKEVHKGILMRAAERLDALERRVERLEK